CRREQGRSRVPAWRHVREAPQADGRMGELLCAGSADRARQGRGDAAAMIEAKMPEGKLELVEENGEPVVYVEFAGERIAKRFAGQGWIMLEPGYRVYGGEPGSYDSISVEYDGNDAQPQ